MFQLNTSMTYTIIEDCSPYYIKFSHPGIDRYIETALQMLQTGESGREAYELDGFDHKRLLSILGKIMIKSTPVSDDLLLTYGRVSYFISSPGLYYRAHKDGNSMRFGINYMLKVLDDKCVTSWYSDEDLKDYPIDESVIQHSRECDGFKKENHTPLKTMVAKQGEVILFNADIFHDWDNRLSSNERIVLTLRPPLGDETTFFDARKALFNF